jgi:hypothetical protein
MVTTCLDPYYAFMISQSLLDEWGFFSYSFIPRHQVQLSCPSVLLFVPGATRPEPEAEDIRLKLCTRKEPSYPSQLFSLFAVSLPPNSCFFGVKPICAYKKLWSRVVAMNIWLVDTGQRRLEKNTQIQRSGISIIRATYFHLYSIISRIGILGYLSSRTLYTFVCKIRVYHSDADGNQVFWDVAYCYWVNS